MKCAVPSRRGLLAALATLWTPVWISPARAQEEEGADPIRVTSDSPEYCETLWRQVRAELREGEHPPGSEGARELAAEGWRLCGEGHLRPGILRLRRALQLLNGAAPHSR